MSRRRSLSGVQQAGAKLGLTLAALANNGRKVKADQGDGKIETHEVVASGTSLRVRYQVRVHSVGLVWMGADKVSFV